MISFASRTFFPTLDARPLPREGRPGGREARARPREAPRHDAAHVREARHRRLSRRRGPRRERRRGARGGRRGAPRRVRRPARTTPKMLGPLLRSVAENVETLGFPEALTGPVRRGDAAAIERQSRSSRRALPDGPPPLRGERVGAAPARPRHRRTPRPEAFEAIARGVSIRRARRRYPDRAPAECAGRAPEQRALGNWRSPPLLHTTFDSVGTRCRPNGGGSGGSRFRGRSRAVAPSAPIGSGVETHSFVLNKGTRWPSLARRFRLQQAAVQRLRRPGQSRSERRDRRGLVDVRVCRRERTCRRSRAARRARSLCARTRSSHGGRRASRVRVRGAPLFRELATQLGLGAAPERPAPCADAIAQAAVAKHAAIVAPLPKEGTWDRAVATELARSTRAAARRASCPPTTKRDARLRVDEHVRGRRRAHAPATSFAGSRPSPRRRRPICPPRQSRSLEAWWSKARRVRPPTRPRVDGARRDAARAVLAVPRARGPFASARRARRAR